VLLEAGYSDAETRIAGLFADSRWPGRICGAWRNEYGHVGTLWTRSIDDSVPGDGRYLYLRGASRTGLPPYGLSEVLAGPHELRRDLTLVEGFFDYHQLRAHGFDNVAALGGLAASPSMFERLSQLGVERVTLCLDRDEPGRIATVRAIENASRAPRSPTVLVVDPECLAPADDPDTLVRDFGVEAWPAAVAESECAIAWRAERLLEGVTLESDAPLRREALARAGSWLASLPPRLALEQEDAIGAAAEQCGYSRVAVERAFRARFWGAPAGQRDSLGRDVDVAPDL
jgi:DNA primase